MVEACHATQNNAVGWFVVIGEKIGGHKGVHKGEHGVLHCASSIEMSTMAYGVLRREHCMRSIRSHNPVKFFI